jgi:Ca2+-dependent lipid-binding protein
MRMKKSLISIAGATLLTSLASLPVAAQSNEPVFGRELMTQEELQEHRTTMRNLNTDAERARYRQLHHERMLQRARERGVELNNGMGKGSGKGMGAGRGMGSGQGQGLGKGSGQGMGNGQGMGQGKSSGGNGKNQEYRIKGSGNQ